MKLRNYQERIAEQACAILQKHRVVMLCMEVRTGKTLTALHITKLYGAASVLFITKKKAISSIEKDFKHIINPVGPIHFFRLKVINYEQVGNIKSAEKYDLIILDESHCLGQFPKPAERTKKLKEICKDKPIIYLTGTPTPESYSQLYHQFWVSSYSPWIEYPTFYKWHKDYGISKHKFIYNRAINDYTQVKEEDVLNSVKHLVISYTQEEAGFIMPVEERIINIPMLAHIENIIKHLKRDKIHFIIKRPSDVKTIMADTAVKEMQKIHQICSGTVIDNEGEILVFCHQKAQYIKKHFGDQKIAIFYKYIGELIAIMDVFDNVTNNPEEFNKKDYKGVFVSQISSGREGINLSSADCLIMYNIDFSAVSYWQARARLQSMERQKPAIVYWLFTEGGIEKEVYDIVQGKKNFTLKHYKKSTKLK